MIAWKSVKQSVSDHAYANKDVSTWTYFELILGELLRNKSCVTVSQANHISCSDVQFESPFPDGRQLASVSESDEQGYDLLP